MSQMSQIRSLCRALFDIPQISTFRSYVSLSFGSDKSHPKTVIEMWITCLDRVSANAAKGRGREREERMGERLQWRFGKSGEARKSGLVQIVVEVSEIRGGLPSTWPFKPVFGWCGRSVLKTIGMDCSSERRAIIYILLR